MEKQYSLEELIFMSPDEVRAAGYPELAAAMETGVIDEDTGFPSMSGYGLDMRTGQRIVPYQTALDEKREDAAYRKAIASGYSYPEERWEGAM